VSAGAGPRVLYLSPMDYGRNPGVDAIAHGLQHRLALDGIELVVEFTDFARPDWLQAQEAAVRMGLDARVAGIVLYVLDPTEPARLAAEARGRGVVVLTFERPRFPVNGSLVYPNFNQGVYMAEELAAALAPGARVAVIGGPKIIDDEELLAGIVHGVRHSGLDLVNDPTLDRYRNASDVRDGGREAALRVLADHPRLDGMIPFNDETMLGTLDALDHTGRAGEMLLVSRNGTPNAVRALKDGRTLGTWDIDCPAIGAALGALVVRALADPAAMERELAIGPIGRMITAANVASWVPWSERVPQVPLRRQAGP
jgi:ABC-type sugar transport system substrate-binding protein